MVVVHTSASLTCYKALHFCGLVSFFNFFHMRFSITVLAITLLSATTVKAIVPPGMSQGLALRQGVLKSCDSDVRRW
jgi:hypothetical protein